MPPDCGWRRALGCLCCAAALSVTAACGSSGSAPSTAPSSFPRTPSSSPAPKPKGYFTLSIHDSVRGHASVACPTGTPKDAQCYLLVESGDSPQLGVVTVAPVMDVEFSSQPPCGASHSFVEKLRFPSAHLIVRVTAPYLCLGVVGTTNRRFVVETGTGRFAGYTGSGSIEFNTLTSGAAEYWTGILLRH